MTLKCSICNQSVSRVYHDTSSIGNFAFGHSHAILGLYFTVKGSSEPVDVANKVKQTFFIMQSLGTAIQHVHFAVATEN